MLSIPWRIAAAVGLCALCAAAPRAAAAPRLELPRASWSRIEYGHDYVVPQACTFKARRLVPVSSDYRLTVFLNFDGAPLQRGPNDARNNTTDLIGTPTYEYPALDWTRFGGREQGMKNTVDELKLLYGEFAVEFVTSRPADGDYTMVVVGGKGQNIRTGSPSAVGVAPLDCDNDNPNDLALVFGQSVDAVEQLAYVIAHELGHTFGLEHVADTKDIMYEALTGDTCCWTDSPISDGGSCGRTTQDASAVLTENVGVGPGDTIPPLVWIVRPGEGAVVPPDFSFEVGSADDLRVHHVVLYVDGEQRAEIQRPPFVIPLLDLPEGEHVLRAEAFDYKPNQVSTEVTITVSASCPAQGDCYFGAAAMGASCAAGTECASGICAKKDDHGVCAISCAGDQGSCPGGTSCTAYESEWICSDGDGWELDRGSTGCALGGAAAWPQLVIPLLPLALLLAARRRRGAPRPPRPAP